LSFRYEQQRRVQVSHEHDKDATLVCTDSSITGDPGTPIDLNYALFVDAASLPTLAGSREICQSGAVDLNPLIPSATSQTEDLSRDPLEEELRQRRIPTSTQSNEKSPSYSGMNVQKFLLIPTFSKKQIC
ncbi:unnamed protein product, partial [Protopolystoma xenopodis]